MVLPANLAVFIHTDKSLCVRHAMEPALRLSVSFFHYVTEAFLQLVPSFPVVPFRGASALRSTLHRESHRLSLILSR